MTEKVATIRQKLVRILEEICTVCQHPYKNEYEDEIWCPHCGFTQPKDDI